MMYCRERAATHWCGGGGCAPPTAPPDGAGASTDCRGWRAVARLKMNGWLIYFNNLLQLLVRIWCCALLASACGSLVLRPPPPRPPPRPRPLFSSSDG